MPPSTIMPIGSRWPTARQRITRRATKDRLSSSAIRSAPMRSWTMAAYLGRSGVPVALVVPFDGTASFAASSNVARVLNLSQHYWMSRGPGFHGSLINVDLRGRSEYRPSQHRQVAAAACAGDCRSACHCRIAPHGRADRCRETAAGQPENERPRTSSRGFRAARGRAGRDERGGEACRGRRHAGDRCAGKNPQTDECRFARVDETGCSFAIAHCCGGTGNSIGTQLTRPCIMQS